LCAFSPTFLAYFFLRGVTVVFPLVWQGLNKHSILTGRDANQHTSSLEPAYIIPCNPRHLHAYIIPCNPRHLHARGKPQATRAPLPHPTIRALRTATCAPNVLLCLCCCCCCFALLLLLCSAFAALLCAAMPLQGYQLRAAAAAPLLHIFPSSRLLLRYAADPGRGCPFPGRAESLQQRCHSSALRAPILLQHVCARTGSILEIKTGT